MRRADRLFRLVQLLRTSPVRTGASLAEELGVSLRTVYRDIGDLEAQGVPIEGEAGVGYRLARGHDLPPMTFTAAEIEALVLGARMVGSWADGELASASQSAVDKIREVLPTLLRPLADETTLFVPHLRASDDALGPLRVAIRDRRKVRLSYENGQGEATDRVVWPLGLFFWGKRWSLVGWCELRGDSRNFRVDRIAAVDVLDATYPLDQERSLQAALAREQERIGEGFPRIRGV